MPSDASLIEEIQQGYPADLSEWREIRDEANVDMRYVSGDPWDPEDREDRESKDRPCLAPDEASQYFNQTINNWRANPRAMKFTPSGNGANDAAARFFENKAREIEYRSHAQVAYTTAGENMIYQSFGFCRVSTKYVHSENFNPNLPPDVSLFNQDIWIEDIPNPHMILPDPYAKRPDLSDQKKCWELEWMDLADFNRAYPGAEQKDFAGDMLPAQLPWFSDDRKRILVAGYWVKRVSGTKTLYLLKPTQGATAQNPQAMPLAVYDDQLPKGFKPPSDQILKTRDIDTYSIKQYMTNGIEILKTTTWAGQHIPIVGCLGKVLYLDSGTGMKRHILSMTRLARDPIMLHAYIRTCQAEIIGAVPRNSWIGYAGQFKDPDKWTDAAHSPVVFLEVEPILDATTQQVLPKPERQPWDPPLQNLEIAAEAAKREIQSSLGGTSLPTAAQRNNEKTGAALDRITAAGQVGNFHYTDHYNDMIRQVAVNVKEIIPKVHDTASVIHVQTFDGKSEQQKVNYPNDPESVSLDGDYNVVIDVGPSELNEREQAQGFIDNMVKNLETVAKLSGPKVAAAVLAMSIKLQNGGPIMNEIADMIEPPEFKTKDGQPPSPEVRNLLLHIQQLTQQLQQATQEIETGAAKERIKLEGEKEIKTMDIGWQREKAHLDASVKEYVAELGAKVDRQELLLRGLKEAADIAHGREQRIYDAIEATKDRHHDLNTAALGHLASHAQSDQDHAEALREGAQAVAGQIATANAQPEATAAE